MRRILPSSSEVCGYDKILYMKNHVDSKQHASLSVWAILMSDDILPIVPDIITRESALLANFSTHQYKFTDLPQKMSLMPHMQQLHLPLRSRFPQYLCTLRQDP